MITAYLCVFLLAIYMGIHVRDDLKRWILNPRFINHRDVKQNSHVTFLTVDVATRFGRRGTYRLYQAQYWFVFDTGQQVDRVLWRGADEDLDAYMRQKYITQFLDEMKNYESKDSPIAVVIKIDGQDAQENLGEALKGKEWN